MSAQGLGRVKTAKVMTDKTQREHNESGLLPEAGIRADMDLRPLGPNADFRVAASAAHRGD